MCQLSSQPQYYVKSQKYDDGKWGFLSLSAKAKYKLNLARCIKTNIQACLVVSVQPSTQQINQTLAKQPSLSLAYQHSSLAQQYCLAAQLISLAQNLTLSTLPSSLFAWPSNPWPSQQSSLALASQPRSLAQRPILAGQRSSPVLILCRGASNQRRMFLPLGCQRAQDFWAQITDVALNNIMHMHSRIDVASTIDD